MGGMRFNLSLFLQLDRYQKENLRFRLKFNVQPAERRTKILSRLTSQYFYHARAKYIK
jgi:hypothetical protein